MTSAVPPSPSREPRPNLSLVFRHSFEPSEALDRFVGGLTDMGGLCADTLEEVRTAPDGVDLVLHPAALPVEIRSLPGLLRASAFTLSLGPGYHAHVADALVAAAEGAGLVAAHDVIDSYLASGSLSTVQAACEAYWASAVAAASDHMGHVAIEGLRVRHAGRLVVPSGLRVPTDVIVPAEHALWWEPGLNDTMRLRRAAYQLRFVIPPRLPLDELEVGRMESLCDDLDALQVSLGDHAELQALRAPWRAVLDALDALRERPRHLDAVTPDWSISLRVGEIWVRAQRDAWLALSSTMSVTFRDEGTFWAADEELQLWLEVHPVELLPDAPAPSPADVLDAVGEWSEATLREADRFLEWETVEDAHVLHAAVWLGGQVGLLTIQCEHGARGRAEALARSLVVSPR